MSTDYEREYHAQLELSVSVPIGPFSKALETIKARNEIIAPQIKSLQQLKMRLKELIEERASESLKSDVIRKKVAADEEILTKLDVKVTLLDCILTEHSDRELDTQMARRTDQLNLRATRIINEHYITELGMQLVIDERGPSTEVRRFMFLSNGEYDNYVIVGVYKGKALKYSLLTMSPKPCKQLFKDFCQELDRTNDVVSLLYHTRIYLFALGKAYFECSADLELSDKSFYDQK